MWTIRIMRACTNTSAISTLNLRPAHRPGHDRARDLPGRLHRGSQPRLAVADRGCGGDGVGIGERYAQPSGGSQPRDACHDRPQLQRERLAVFETRGVESHEATDILAATN